MTRITVMSRERLPARAQVTRKIGLLSGVCIVVFANYVALWIAIPTISATGMIGSRGEDLLDWMCAPIESYAMSEHVGASHLRSAWEWINGPFFTSGFTGDANGQLSVDATRRVANNDLPETARSTSTE